MPPEYEQLLDLTGILADTHSSMQDSVARLRADNPDVPESVWSNFATRVADHDSLMSIYAPVYARHIPVADARILIAFYRGPLGRRLLDAMPKIRQECAAAAQAHVAQLLQELLGNSAPDADMEAPTTADQLPASRIASIHELLHASGALAQAQQSMGLLLDVLQRTPQAGELPASFWLPARARLQDETALLRIWTPAYAKYLPDEDIRGLLEFYRSAAGQRYIAALPAIQSEALEAATQFANMSARRALRDELGPLPQLRLQRPLTSPDTRAPPAVR